MAGRAAGGGLGDPLVGLCVLAFGIAPHVPPAAAIVGAVALTAGVIALLPHWAAGAGWRRAHDYALILGALIGSMAVSFVGFIGAADADLWFKIAADLLALVLLLLARRRLSGAPIEPRRSPRRSARSRKARIALVSGRERGG